MMENKKILTAIDMGTTKINILIAELDLIERNFTIIGSANDISKGVTSGRIDDTQALQIQLEKVISKAEKSVEDRELVINNAFFGVASSSIESLMGHASKILGKTHRVITEDDKKALEDLAENKIVPVDRKVIHKISHNYKIDDHTFVANPVGMWGLKVDADVHIVAGAINPINSLDHAVKSLSIITEDIVLEPLAAAKSALTDTEKKTGSVLIDIGGGTTDIAIYRNGKLLYTSVIPIGGEFYTSDIATGLQIELKTAERLKKQLATYYQEEVDEDTYIEIPTNDYKGVKEINVSTLKMIVDARTDEILELVKNKLEASGYINHLVNGIVFTGGSSKIIGLEEKASKYFELPVRIGIPVKFEGLSEKYRNPEDSTAVGLLLYGAEKYLSGNFIPINTKLKEPGNNLFKIIKLKVADWIDVLF